MMMIKSSWRILIVLLVSLCSFNLSNGQQDVQQQVELSLGEIAPPPPSPPRWTQQQPNQQPNSELIKFWLNDMRSTISSPLADSITSYERSMIQLINQASDQRKAFDDFKSRRVNAVRPSSIISERQTLENLETGSVTIYDSLMGEPIIYRTNSPASYVESQFSELAKNLRTTINKIHREIPKIVVKHREAQIDGNVHFNLKKIPIKVISRSTNVRNIGQSNLLDNLVYRQRNSQIQINGPVHLIKRSSAKKLVVGTTSGLNLAQAVYRGMSRVHINSPLRIGSLSSDLVSTRSSLGHDDLIFLNSPTPVTINSRLNFDSRLIIDNNDLNVSTISGVYLPTFKSSALTYNSDQIVYKPIGIRSVQVPGVQLNGQLNGLDYNRRVVRLLRSDLPLNVPRLIVASESFRANNLHNVRKLNNQRFPDDFLLANSVQPQTIPVPINFSNLRITRGVNVKGLINGFKYPESFVTLDSNEKIDSNLIFSDSISFNKDITSDNYIGKHRLSDLVDWAHGRNPLLRQLRDNPSGNVFVNGDLQVTSTINNLQLNGLLNDLVHLSESNVIQVTGLKTFNTQMNIPSITIKEINRSPLTDFASSSAPIISPIQFVNPLVINNLIWKSRGKSNRISDLINKRISLVQEGTINGDISIENMSIDSLQIDPLEGHRINNLSTRQLVFSGQTQHIHGPLTFTNVNFLGTIWSTKFNIDRTLNQRETKRIMRNLVDPRKRQNYNFDRLVLKNCLINSLIPSSSGDWTVRNKLLVNSLRNLLLKNSDQVIYGRKKFLYPVSFESTIKSRSSRGVLLGMQNSPLFTSSNNIIINERLRLSQLLIHGNLIIKGRLNGIDLSVPLTDLLDHRKGLYTMTGPQSFYSGLVATTIQVKFINGQPFDNYWSRRKPLQFMVPVTVGNLIVDGQIQLNGLVNNLPIEKVINQIQDQHKRQSITIHGDVVFKSPINIINGLNISGLINSVNFGWLTRSLEQLSTIKEIVGVKTFDSINLKGNLRVNRLNGQQLNNFLHNIVLIHPHKLLLLASPVEFTSMTTIRSNITSDQARTNFISNVNGISIRNLLNVHQQQFKRSTIMNKATLIFTDPVIIRSPSITIMGKVNNLDLKRDIIWLRDYFQPNQIITGHKSFKRAHFVSNVYVHSTLNGIDWTDRLRKIIDPRSNQNINESIKFGGKMILTSGLFVSMIDNIPATSLIATNRPGIIRVPARWTFNGPSLIVENHLTVDGRIKNVSFNNFIRYSLKNHIPQTINVPMNFDRIILKSIDPVSNMFTDLQSIQQSYSNRWNQVASRLQVLDEIVSSNYQISSRILKYIDSSPIVIKGFQMVQQFPEIIGSTIDLKSNLKRPTISVGSLVDENVSYSNLIFNGSRFIVQGNQMITPYITVHPLQLDQSKYNLYQASPNSTYPSVLINNQNHVIGQLGGQAYDDLQILSINGRDKFISALSSVRGVIETFTLSMVNGQPNILLISTLNVTPNAKKISLFMMINEIYLAVARSSDSDCESDESSSLLFHWLDKQFKLIQRFGHFEASNVVYYKFNGHSYLVFSESKGQVDRLTDKAIHVYQSVFKEWPYCQFNHFHSINFEKAIDLQVITVPSPSRSVQLLAALNSSTLTIWQQKGNAGFKRIWSQSLNEGQAFKFFIINSNLYLIVAQLSRQIGSFIMKAIS